MLWIRFESYVRYHAVFLEATGGYWTFCGLFFRETGLKGKTESPNAKCRCCSSRQQRPYLVPEKLLRLKETYAISSPAQA